MRFNKVVWSPVEEDYLKKNKTKPVNQLCIALAKSQAAVKKRLKELETGGVTLPATKIKKGRSKIGRRPDCNNLFFRSTWEANCYRLMQLDPNITLIEYEPTTFSFAPFGILNGTVSYTPDFKITFADGTYLWIEIKGGFLRRQDQTKITRFRKYYPAEFQKMVAITPGEGSKTYQWFLSQNIPIRWKYPEINKQYKNTVPNWE